MEREDVRLECVKLTFSHGRGSTEAIAEAKLLESYINFAEVTSSPVKVDLPPKKRKGRPKKVDNPSILS